MDRKVYYFETIGEVEFEKNSRSRSLRITVKPYKGVKVTFPNHISLSKAFRFVEEKSEWIRKSVDRIKTFEHQRTKFLPGSIYKTNEHKLEFVNQTVNEFKVKVSKGIIRVFYHSEEQLNSDAGQELIRKGIDHALKVEAKKILPERLAFLAKQHGLSYEEVRVKNLKSRWGSCSSSNNINLNIHLVRLPEHLMDYVILHELAHTVHKNHGKNFWYFLDKLSGNARLLAKEMKNYRTQVY